MVVRMRHTRSQRGKVRSHHFLKNAGSTKCPDCGSACLRHTACRNCGKYKGRVVIDLQAKVLKKAKKAKKAGKEETK